MCCGFGVEARALAVYELIEKIYATRRSRFFVRRSHLAARIPPQSPVTWRYHRAELAMGLLLFEALLWRKVAAWVRELLRGFL